jgi:hypothetical protein
MYVALDNVQQLLRRDYIEITEVYTSSAGDWTTQNN